MLSVFDVAKYFLLKDKDHKLFTKKVVVSNGRRAYEGNIRLNKYLFLSQVVYLAKYDRKLFEEDFVAYDNGPVIEDIMSSYNKLLKSNYNLTINNTDTKFLDKIYMSLENASFEELIEITHEDPEWQLLSNNTYNAPVMNLEKHIGEYKKRYKGLIEALKI